MRTVIPVLITVMALAIFACGGDEAATDMTGMASAITIPTGDESVLLLSTSYFERTMDSEGRDNFQLITYLPEGSTVTLVENKKIDFKLGADNYRVSLARLKDGREVYISIWYLLPKQRLAVVTAQKEARVYSGLQPVDVTQITLPRGTLIGVQPLEESDENRLKRQRMVCYTDRNGKAVMLGTWQNFYIDNADISERKDDLELASNLQKLEQQKDRSLWEVIINNAIKLSPSSVFVVDAKKILDDLKDSAMAPKIKISYTANAVINDDDDVNVRQEPDETKQNIIGRLPAGEIVRVTSRTESQFSVSGDYDFWYEIKSGDLVGWVFGTYLSFSE